ncbi:hypothetical protein [Ferrimicrobium sp.]|uniref:hypothetical protein n=1 Tax=Ferrimicrobium sp. TaxID=2926050 RepID=UPI002621737D|nr:hypothetical protein [Ferrimicrobium sp.]
MKPASNWSPQGHERFFDTLVPVRAVGLMGVVVLAAALATGVLLVTHAWLVAALFGLTGGIFVLGALSDSRTGTIPNALMASAALASIALQVDVNGWPGAAIRVTCIAVVWIVFASLRHGRSGAGGGDLKMIGVTWLTLGVFPVLAGLVALMGWALILVVILSALQLCHVRHFRAGPALAIAAIISWIIALAILF